MAGSSRASEKHHDISSTARACTRLSQFAKQVWSLVIIIQLFKEGWCLCCKLSKWRGIHSVHVHGQRRQHADAAAPSRHAVAAAAPVASWRVVRQLLQCAPVRGVKALRLSGRLIVICGAVRARCCVCVCALTHCACSPAPRACRRTRTRLASRVQASSRAPHPPTPSNSPWRCPRPRPCGTAPPPAAPSPPRRRAATPRGACPPRRGCGRRRTAGR